MANSEPARAVRTNGRLGQHRLLVTIVSVAVTVSGSAARDPDLECGPIENVEELPVEPLLLFGELHGTDLSPAAFADVACHLGRKHGEVVIGLEIGHDEQERLDAFLASDGSEGDRRRLLSGAFWTDPYQDGRRSRAMAELLEALRALRATGIDVRVVAFDPLPDVDFRDREEGMARNLVDAWRRHPGEPFAVLTGNIHPRTTRGAPWDPEFVPMGRRIEAAGVDVLPLELRHAGGSAWTCTGASADDCGPLSIGGSGEPRETATLELFSEPDADTGYAGALWVGEVAASPPAFEGSRPGK